MEKIEFSSAPVAVSGADDLLAQARKVVDPRDPRTLLALAPQLYSLAQDKDLLQRHVNLGLANWRKGTLYFYSPQSCHVASQGNFVIRINLWPLLPDDPARRAILADVLSYYDYHDHNFSFLTANYFGPGYATEMYRYDPATVAGFPGEKVHLDYLGRHVLDARTVMLYEEFRDVHMQLPPPAVSCSINLLMYHEHSGLTNQHYFDPAKGEITGYVESFSHRRVNALGFARYLHDGSTLAVLEEILETHPCSRTRVEAAAVLTAIAGDAALTPHHRSRMLRDPLARQLWATHTARHAVGQPG